MEMRDDKIRVAKLPVEWRSRQHDAGQTGDEELEEKADAEQHGSGQPDLAAVHCGQPVEDLDAGGDPTSIVATTKNALDQDDMPTVNMWCAHTPRLRKPMADSRAHHAAQPKIGLREKTGMISETTAKPGMTRT